MDISYFQATQQLLQVTFSPETYRMILSKYRRGQPRSRFSADLAGQEYWDNLPTYLVARCPFCASCYTAKIDTHSLNGWSLHPELYEAVYDEEYQDTGCAHFVGVQTFVNLRGKLQHDLELNAAQMDVPYITPTILPADIPSMAVMHSLPIC